MKLWTKRQVPCDSSRIMLETGSGYRGPERAGVGQQWGWKKLCHKDWSIAQDSTYQETVFQGISLLADKKKQKDTMAATR